MHGAQVETSAEVGHGMVTSCVGQGAQVVSGVTCAVEVSVSAVGHGGHVTVS